MNETPEELAELATDIFTEGIEVNINVGPKEVLAVIGVATVTTVATHLTIGMITVALKRSIAKAKKNTEEAES